MIEQVSTNVLRSGTNRLKLGLFSTNKTAAMTTAPEQLKITWENLAAVAREADQMGLEAIVPVARWKGYIDDFAHPSNEVFDPFIYAAAVAQVTSSVTIFATTHAPTVHPVFAAKQCATIDRVSQGRFALNVVGGWNRPEFDMFGIPLREHDDRYTYLEEWVTLVRRLWSSEEAFDYQSRTFTLRGALSRPAPLQQGGIAIMNAGLSGRGRAFAAEYADMCLVFLRGTDEADWRRQVSEYKQFAVESFGREVQVWTCASITVRDSVDEAQAYVERISVEMFDEVAADGYMESQARDNPNLTGPLYESVRKALRMPGPGGMPVTGSPEVVAATLGRIANAGVDGVLLAYVDVLGELQRLRADVLPLLEEMGLRSVYSDSLPRSSPTQHAVTA